MIYKQYVLMAILNTLVLTKLKKKPAKQELEYNLIHNFHKPEVPLMINLATKPLQYTNLYSESKT